ncbi:MAG: hypothetical protein Q8N58_01230 [bacterium]|nr:hypothetical protein [bacterium]
MKRTIILAIAIVVLISTGTAMAQPYRARPWTMGGQKDYHRNHGRSYSRGAYGSSYGSYGYGYSHYGYGSDRSLSDAIFGWTDERKLRMAEKEQDFRHEQERAKTEQIEREQMFARVKALKEKQAGQEQKSSENEKLRQEVEKLELELKKAQFEKELKMFRPTDPNEP